MILERSYFLSFTFDFDLVKNRSYDALLLLIVSLKPRHERDQSFLIRVPARSLKRFSAGPNQKNIFVPVPIPASRGQGPLFPSLFKLLIKSNFYFLMYLSRFIKKHLAYEHKFYSQSYHNYISIYLF
jgi:hypothetical protein